METNNNISTLQNRNFYVPDDARNAYIASTKKLELKSETLIRTTLLLEKALKLREPRESTPVPKSLPSRVFSSMSSPFTKKRSTSLSSPVSPMVSAPQNTNDNGTTALRSLKEAIGKITEIKDLDEKKFELFRKNIKLIGENLQKIKDLEITNTTELQNKLSCEALGTTYTTHWWDVLRDIDALMTSARTFEKAILAANGDMFETKENRFRANTIATPTEQRKQ